MKSLFFTVAFLSSFVSNCQVKTVFEVHTQDVLQFEDGHYIHIPANRAMFQHDYLVELDTVYTLTKVTLDRTVPNVEFYGYKDWESQKGQFNLMFISNDSDQIFLLNHEIRYLLIRSSGELFTPLNLDLELK